MTLDVLPGPVRRQPVRGRSLRPVAGLLAGLAAVVVLGVVVSSTGQPATIGPGASMPPSAAASAPPAGTISPSATSAPTPLPTAAPSPVAADGLPPIDSSPLPAPNLAFWTVEGDAIHILLWDPMTSEMTETATVETWTGDTIERTVLFAPNGALFAVHEIDVTTSSPVQRLRVFHFDGALWWEAPRLTYVTALAWSADGTALAIGSLPTPWTVISIGDTARIVPARGLDLRARRPGRVRAPRVQSRTGTPCTDPAPAARPSTGRSSSRWTARPAGSAGSTRSRPV